MSHIRTKICGITRPEDATAAVSFGADAIGFNFYPNSKRFIDVDEADEISLIHSNDIATFGVFVNATAAEIATVARQIQLSHVQLHGDEKPEIVGEITKALPDVLIARAIRIADNNMEHAQSEVDRWTDAGTDLILLDAAAPDAFGGTGHRLDWNQVSKLHLPQNWLLAGGLTAENVSVAIGVATPGGVDVASGVESSPGIKDQTSMSLFIAHANHSFESIQNS